jgi:hypothetical protein
VAGECGVSGATGDVDLVGLVGYVNVPIPANGPGVVVLAVRGGTESFAAWADEPVAKHARVLVIEARSPRSVTVVPYS